jgi:DUF971 family protein
LGRRRFGFGWRRIDSIAGQVGLPNAYPHPSTIHAGQLPYQAKSAKSLEDVRDHMSEDLMMSVSASHRPRDIDVNRSDRTVTITWADWHTSTYSLAWLRANCPCATCREERWQAQNPGEELSLSSKPPPVAEVESASLVGGYAIQFTWADGHAAGIYGFAALRRSCPCTECSPDGPPAELE